MKKHLLKNIKKKFKIKEKYNENEEEKAQISLEKFRTVLKSIDIESIESLHQKSYELSLISNDFMDNKDVSNIDLDERLSNFSVTINCLNKMRKRGDHSSSINNIMTNDNSKINNKCNKKKIQHKVYFEPRKNQANKQLINSQKSYKNIIQNYLKKDTKPSNSNTKPIFHKIQPLKVAAKESSQLINREKNRNSQHKFEDSKNKTPQILSQTPVSFKTNLKSIQTNLTSRNSIISPTTFLKVNLTKENILEKSRKGLSIPINQLKGKYDNPSQLSNSDYNSNKELISSSIFKTIMSNLVTPSKKLNKLVKKCI